MKNRKPLILLVLVVLALAIWTFNFMNSRESRSGDDAGPGKSTQLAGERADLARTISFEYKPDFRDPFSSPFAHKPKPKKVAKKAKPKPRRPQRPPYAIGGINWNPNNPMTLLQPRRGEPSLVGVGDSLPDLRVHAIFPESVVVYYKSRKYTLKAD